MSTGYSYKLVPREILKLDKKFKKEQEKRTKQKHANKNTEVNCKRNSQKTLKNDVS